MKIEKINDNQIKCTLTRDDLETHHIRISELAYGSDNAKRLFQDMMEQARSEFGFEAENIPLMIEAIPINMESLILIITKVDDPEELDTRFSRFSPFKGEGAGQTKTLEMDGADNVLDFFQKLMDGHKEHAPQNNKDGAAKEDAAEKASENAAPSNDAPSVDMDMLRAYKFKSLDEAILASKGLKGFYKGDNVLFKNREDGVFTLVLHKSAHTPEEFNKVCNVLSEYGSGYAFTEASEAYLFEHSELIARNAVLTLCEL